MYKIEGFSASPGLAIGPVFVFQEKELDIQSHQVLNSEIEMQRLQDAMGKAQTQLLQLSEDVREKVGMESAEIFRAQISMLNDPELTSHVNKKIIESGASAELAYQESAEYYADILDNMKNEYFKARALDVRDVSKRVLNILLGREQDLSTGITRPSIIVARDLTPSETLLLDKSLVLGFCTVEGGPTSHTAILARSLGLPALINVKFNFSQIPEDSEVVLDAENGFLLVEPDIKTLLAYREKKSLLEEKKSEALKNSLSSAVTIDDHRVEVVANIGDLKNAKTAIQYGAEGIGLLRTEFQYLERHDLPLEEEQYLAYRSILDIFDQLPVVLRTLDIGGDKQLPYLDLPKEMNPFLGVRAIRLCLQRPDIFKPQLRAALRAGVGHNLKLMFPMVATLSEVQESKKIVAECQSELRKEGIPQAEKTEIGIMVEIPSTAVMADLFAREVDFFSIGTNDLTQYVMAADRTNAQLSYLSDSLHPAVLRLISQIIEAAHNEGKWVGLCGELAGEPIAIPILLGMGLDEFSMNPSAIPQAKEIIRNLKLSKAKDIAKHVIRFSNSQEVKSYVIEKLPQLFQ